MWENNVEHTYFFYWNLNKKYKFKSKKTSTLSQQNSLIFTIKMKWTYHLSSIDWKKFNLSHTEKTYQSYSEIKISRTKGILLRRNRPLHSISVCHKRPFFFFFLFFLSPSGFPLLSTVVCDPRNIFPLPVIEIELGCNLWLALFCSSMVIFFFFSFFLIYMGKESR